MLEPKQCDRCKKDYTPRSNRQRWCSDECKELPRRCKYCGKVFTPSRGSDGTFCSHGCAANYKWDERGRKPTKPCATCQKEINSQRRKYCSKACTIIGLRKRGTCYLCGNPTTHARNRYCSKECAAKVSAKVERHKRYIGDKKINRDGYIQVKTAHGWEYEHRLVMEKMLDRKLLRKENVHHKDGNRANNSEQNLELWTRPQPTGVRPSDYHCPGCQCTQPQSIIVGELQQVATSSQTAFQSSDGLLH